jgi:hypothetical protein
MASGFALPDFAEQLIFDWTGRKQPGLFLKTLLFLCNPIFE